MTRAWRPLVVGAVVAAATFALAKAQIFAPSSPAAAIAGGGDVYRGETVFQRECASCHSQGGVGGSAPRIQGTGLDATLVTTQIRQGGGIMSAGLVTGRDEADVVAYVVSISTP